MRISIHSNMPVLSCGFLIQQCLFRETQTHNVIHKSWQEKRETVIRKAAVKSCTGEPVEQDGPDVRSLGRQQVFLCVDQEQLDSCLGNEVFEVMHSKQLSWPPTGPASWQWSSFFFKALVKSMVPLKRVLVSLTRVFLLTEQPLEVLH